MQDHYQLTDQEFEQQFATLKFDASLFTHEAHLRLAWIHIKRYGANAAIRNITKQLKAFVTSLGVENKYNETVTIAAVKAVHHFINRSTAHSFQSFIEANARLKNNFRELLASHYSINVFLSPEARLQFLEPDLLPFDC